MWGKHSAKQQKTTLHLPPAESLIAPCTLSPPAEQWLTLTVPLLSWSKVRFSFTSLTKSFLCWCVLAKNETHESVLCSVLKNWNKESLKSSSHPSQSLLLAAFTFWRICDIPFSLHPTARCPVLSPSSIRKDLSPNMKRVRLWRFKIRKQKL